MVDDLVLQRWARVATGSLDHCFMDVARDAGISFDRTVSHRYTLYPHVEHGHDGWERVGIWFASVHPVMAIAGRGRYARP